MEMTYYFGDWMLIKVESMRGFNYYFNGAYEKDGKWHVNMTFGSNEGYAGGAAGTKLVVSAGDTIRFSKGMEARIKVDGLRKEKKKAMAVSAMQFQSIEKDCIKVYFDLV